MDGLTTFPSLHNSFILSVICSKIRMHRSFQLNCIDKPNISMKSCRFIFQSWVLKIGINSNRSKLISLIEFLLVILPVLDSILEFSVPLLKVILEEGRWILIRGCLRLYRPCTWRTSFIELYCI